MRLGLQSLAVILLATLASAVVLASTGVDAKALPEALRAEIQKKYPGLEVSLAGSVHWEEGSLLPSRLDRLTLLHEKRPGLMAFQVAGNNPETGTPILSVGAVPFSVKAQAIVPKRRILPGAALQKEDFVVQKVDVTTGFLAEVRGLLLNKDESVQGLEARNTLLEGQPVLVNGVQRIPALKRGEPVRLKVLSGTVALVTEGVAEEPGHLNQKVRVTSRLTKRTLVGKLVEGGTVEVEL